MVIFGPSATMAKPMAKKSDGAACTHICVHLLLSTPNRREYVHALSIIAMLQNCPTTQKPQKNPVNRKIHLQMKESAACNVFRILFLVAQPNRNCTSLFVSPSPAFVASGSILTKFNSRRLPTNEKRKAHMFECGPCASTELGGAPAPHRAPIGFCVRRRSSTGRRVARRAARRAPPPAARRTS